MGCASSTAGDESSNDPPPGAAVTPTVTLSGPRKQPWLAVQVEAAGGIEAWNKKDPYRAYLLNSLSAMCQATTPEEALVEVFSIMEMGHNLWAYAYMRMLYEKQPEVYYGALLAQPAKLLPVVYTPTVGEACQKFGKMPHYKRGCYISIEDRGRIKETLIGYAQKYMKCEGEKYIVGIRLLPSPWPSTHAAHSRAACAHRTSPRWVCTCNPEPTLAHWPKPGLAWPGLAWPGLAWPGPWPLALPTGPGLAPGPWPSSGQLSQECLTLVTAWQIAWSSRTAVAFSAWAISRRGAWGAR